jgi:hypothetical protein
MKTITAFVSDLGRFVRYMLALTFRAELRIPI